MNSKFKLYAPWEPIESDASAAFEDEYATEIGKGHPLYGVPVKAIARRSDCDDVLFRLLRHLCEYAVVHLTWSRKEEPDTQWPKFEIYADGDDLMELCIRPSNRGQSE